MNPQFLNTKEAAKFLRVELSTIYAWVHARKIPHRKHGSRLVFEINELLEWSDAQKKPPIDE